MAKDISASIELDGVVQEIAHEIQFPDIAVDAGIIPDFMKIFPEKLPAHDRSSWKMVGEIYLERERFLISADEMLEEMLDAG